MSSQLWALAMNPYLSEEQFLAATEEVLKAQERRFELMIESIKDLPIDDQLKYISQCMFLLFI
jgi:hypothetical protein